MRLFPLFATLLPDLLDFEVKEKLNEVHIITSEVSTSKICVQNTKQFKKDLKDMLIQTTWM